MQQGQPKDVVVHISVPADSDPDLVLANLALVGRDESIALKAGEIQIWDDTKFAMLRVHELRQSLVESLSSIEQLCSENKEQEVSFYIW